MFQRHRLASKIFVQVETCDIVHDLRGFLFPFFEYRILAGNSKVGKKKVVKLNFYNLKTFNALAYYCNGIREYKFAFSDF